MKDYTKGSLAFRGPALVGLLVLVAWPGIRGEAGPATWETPGEMGAATPADGSFAGWHLPVPAGDW